MPADDARNDVATAPAASTSPTWAWRLVIRMMMWLLQTVLGWDIRGRVHGSPPARSRPMVVVFNHTSNVDAFPVADMVLRTTGRWCQPLVKGELFEIPVIGTVIARAGAIPVARGSGSGRDQAYAVAVERLRSGATIGLAPEGTVTHDGTLLPLRRGAARLAIDGGADVLVVTHFGAQRAFSPVVRTAERNVVVEIALDVVRLHPDEDAEELTGRIAATFLDRSEQLRLDYPQRDESAVWWPPYPAPASPTATARAHIEQYGASMAAAVAEARTRIEQYADDHDLEQRLASARARAQTWADSILDRDG